MTRYVVGIDLGTTNSALACVELADPDRRVRPVPIAQLVGEARVDERAQLPSFLYVGGEHDLPPGSLALPWDATRTYAVGEFARNQGARVPGRLVSSAKSWLCHGGVDREAAILPWTAPADVTKVSPVDASARYLQHLREAWNHRVPDAPLEAQDVVLTVPASFDEVARELTVAAAERAGLPRVTLLEEPLAAFYAWLQHHETTWEADLAGLERIVVVDIGGGTTDFSLVHAAEEGGRVVLERLAVGDHLLLGGDNIDVALARLLEPRLGTQLDSARWHALTNLCRTAKETLLGPEPPADIPIRLVGRGRSVVGGVVTTSLRREEVEQLVLDGFFPLTGPDDGPRRGARTGLQEFGLPFATEAEVSRHLALFLRQHARDTAGQQASGDTAPAWPDAILFNGGALTPPLIRDRLRDLLGGWRGTPPAVLASGDLDLAVARGAAYYGLVRRGKGVRIGGGTARAYYVGVGAPPPAPGTGDGTATPITALCVVHRGMHEGEEIEIAEPALEVLANQGASFPLYASSTRLGDASGVLVTAPPDEFAELPPIRTVLRFGKKLAARKIPVHLVARLNEIGTLEIWAKSLTTEHRWRLQFQLRETMGPSDDEERGEGGLAAEAVIGPEQVAAAGAALVAVFPAERSTPPGDPVPLMRGLEDRLATGKDAWPLHVIRQLWDALWHGQHARGTSPAHEARWCNLCGYLLRPGFGTDLDEWRIEQLWKLRSAGPKFPKAPQVRAEWWGMWKRITGGLGRTQQMQLFNEIAPWVLTRLKSKTKGLPKPGPQEIREYWQVLANCERLSADLKAELGDVLLPAVLKGRATDVEVWSLGRLGARAPFYGPLNCVVARDVVTAWVDALLGAAWAKPESIAFTVAQLARCVGDRDRDLDPGLRARVADRLRAVPSGARLARLVTEHVPLEAQERSKILDESLPVGLQLRAEPTGPSA